jgi:hypothetical protein
MTVDTQAHTDAVRELNDTARQSFTGVRVLVTSGVQALAGFSELIHKVRTFDDFSEDNDPRGEHDFGSFQHEGETVYWKIDYYDELVQFGSEDPTNTELTTRVLTILLSSEY